VGPRAVLDAVVKRKIPSSRRELNSRTQFVQPVAKSQYRLSYHGSLKTQKGKNIKPEIFKSSHSKIKRNGVELGVKSDCWPLPFKWLVRDSKPGSELKEFTGRIRASL
jgi:hypothetical protein